MSDFKHDFVRALKTPLAEVDDRAAARLCCARWRRRAAAVLARERVDAERASSVRTALDLRYVGQWHELTVPIERPAVAAIEDAFRAEHDRAVRLLLARARPVEQLAVRIVGARRDDQAVD